MTAQTESSLEVQLPLPRWTIEGLGDPPRVGFSYSKHCVSAPRKQAWHELAGECRWVPQKHPLGARDGWFYRFSASVVEVFRKENGPLDKLHVLDVLGLPRFDEWGGEIRVTAKFTAAAAGIIEGRPTLVLCIHDSATDTTSVYLNEIFGRRWQKLDCGIKQPVKFVEITQSWESQQLSPFMVFATNEELFAISVSDPQRDEAVDEVSPTFRVVAPLPRARSVGDITSLGTHCDQNDSRLIVFTGSIMGRVDVWRVNSGNKPRIEKLSNFMVGERHMPVVEMLLRDDGQRGGPGTLFVSQSVTKGRGSGDVAKPSISVLPLDAYYAKKDSHATIFPIGEDLGAVVGMNVVASPYGARIFSVVNMYLGVRKTTVLAVTDLSSNGRIKKTTHRPIFNSSSKQVDIEPKGVTACTVLTAGRKIHFFFPPAEPKPVEPKRLVNLADKFVSGSGSFLYKPEKRDSIAKTRAMFDNDLFADILQYRVAPDAPEFPPQNLQELCDLLKHIDACDADPRHKNRFVLYLLKDLKNGEDRAFANERGMDAQDRNEIQAFWALDHGNFKEATELLCEPGAFRSGKLAIETQYSEKIVKVLVLHGEIRYAKRYVAISRPELSSDEGAQLDMILKITTDLFEAIQVQRPYSGTPLGDRLWHMLMEATFKSPKTSKRFMEELPMMPLNDSQQQSLADWCKNDGSIQCLTFIALYSIDRCQFLDAVIFLEMLQARGVNLFDDGPANASDVTDAMLENFRNSMTTIQMAAYRVSKVQADVQASKETETEEPRKNVPLSARLRLREPTSTAEEAQDQLYSEMLACIPKPNIDQRRIVEITVPPSDFLPLAELESVAEFREFAAEIGLKYPKAVPEYMDAIVPLDVGHRISPGPSCSPELGLAMACEPEEAKVPSENGSESSSSLQASVDKSPTRPIARDSSFIETRSTSTPTYEPSPSKSSSRSGTPLSMSYVAPSPRSPLVKSPSIMAIENDENADRVDRIKSPVGPPVKLAVPVRTMSPFADNPVRKTRKDSPPKIIESPATFRRKLEKEIEKASPPPPPRAATPPRPKMMTRLQAKLIEAAQKPDASPKRVKAIAQLEEDREDGLRAQQHWEERIPMKSYMADADWFQAKWKAEQDWNEKQFKLEAERKARQADLEANEARLRARYGPHPVPAEPPARSTRNASRAKKDLDEPPVRSCKPFLDLGEATYIDENGRQDRRLRERNASNSQPQATSSTATKTARAKTTKTTLKKYEPAPDQPMTLEDLEPTPRPKRKAATAALAAITHQPARPATRAGLGRTDPVRLPPIKRPRATPAAQPLGRTVVTRQMRKLQGRKPSFDGL